MSPFVSRTDKRQILTAQFAGRIGKTIFTSLFSLRPRPSSNRLCQQPDFISTVTWLHRRVRQMQAMKAKYVINSDRAAQRPIRRPLIRTWLEYFTTDHD